jgi:hypothetical protein
VTVRTSTREFTCVCLNKRIKEGKFCECYAFVFVCKCARVGMGGGGEGERGNEGGEGNST